MCRPTLPFFGLFEKHDASWQRRGRAKFGLAATSIEWHSRVATAMRFATFWLLTTPESSSRSVSPTPVPRLRSPRPS